MYIRGSLVVLATVLAASTATAQQFRATNDVAACSLIVDPTAQRLCIESAQQSRPASTFDPTAQKLRMERRPPPRRDALSPAGKPTSTANRGIAPGGSAAAPAAKAATPETYRDKNWRLQIP